MGEEHVADTTTLGADTCDAPRTSQGGSLADTGTGVATRVPHSNTTLGGGGRGGPRRVVAAVITPPTVVA